MTKEERDAIRERFNQLKKECFNVKRHEFFAVALISEIPALLDELDDMEKTKNWFKEMFNFATIEGIKKDDEINALERAIKKHKPEDGRFACFSCDIDLGNKESHKNGERCKGCGSKNSPNWQFDTARFTKDGDAQ